LLPPDPRRAIQALLEEALMLRSRGLARRARLIGLAGLATVALAACGSSAGLSSTSTSPAGVNTGSNASGTGQSATTNAAASGTRTGRRGMAGMSMGPAEAKAERVDGITPIPTQILGTSDWQGMKISAMAMTAVPFVIFDGTNERMVKPPKNVSFHLMVDLSDAHTNYPIPYAGVWATIRKAGKIVFDERQWPMISEYIGPHYGNNVVLPGAGKYQLSLLVSPPVSARHIEYQKVWLTPHRVDYTFDWNPRS
jgi:uncharacterized protein involved in high-affinity Fe2+ transport